MSIDSCRSLHPAANFLAQPGGLFIKVTWYSFLRLAALPVCHDSYCHLGSKADKLTLGQELTVQVPHSVLTLMEYKGNYWLTNSRMVKYQSMLCENPHNWLEVVKTLNPTTILPVDSDP
jgi:hypothetical protein